MYKRQVYETTLSEWFHGPNPNWINRPQYMLRRNALSKALEEVAPMGIEADEAPPREGGNLEVKPPMPLPTPTQWPLGGISGTGQKANPSTKGLIP